VLKAVRRHIDKKRSISIGARRSSMSE